MKAPKLAKDKRTQAEVILDQKIEVHAKEAQTPEEIMKVQQMIKNRDEINKEKKFKIDPNTLISVGATVGVAVFQTLRITGFEKEHVLSSKLLPFVPKGRLR